MKTSGSSLIFVSIGDQEYYLKKIFRHLLAGYWPVNSVVITNAVVLLKQLIRNDRKRTFEYLRPARIQISLRILAV